MAQPHNLTALVTLLALALYLATLIRAGRARMRYKVAAPAVTGHDIFERHLRVQANTLESLVLFVPALWLFDLYWAQLWTAVVGVVWLVGRVLYMIGYVKEPKGRAVGFLIQFAALVVLIAGGLIGAARALMVTGGV